jgi:hypothetical protein
MINVSAHHKILRIYIDHNFIVKQRQQIDDVNVYGTGTSDHPLPLISPKNVVSVDDKEDNLSKFYDYVPKSSTNNADCNGFDSDDNASGSEIDGMDSDNEFGQDDDDLFEDKVDSDVEDSMVQYKGKKCECGRGGDGQGL